MTSLELVIFVVMLNEVKVVTAMEVKGAMTLGVGKMLVS